MILITGGAGFIGSNIINYLLRKKKNIVSVDWHNKFNKKYFVNYDFKRIEPKYLKNFLNDHNKKISIIIHLGAITSTVEKNLNLIIENNLRLSLDLWEWCAKNKKRLIYASSAATYGNGQNGFIDSSNDDYLSKLVPLNFQIGPLDIVSVGLQLEQHYLVLLHH